MQLESKGSHTSSHSGLLNSCSDEDSEIELYNDLMAFSDLSPEEQIITAEQPQDCEIESLPFNARTSEEQPAAEIVEDEIAQQTPRNVTAVAESSKEDEPGDVIVTRMGGIVLSLRSDTRKPTDLLPMMDTSTWFDDDTDLDSNDESPIEPESTSEPEIESDLATRDHPDAINIDEQAIQLGSREIGRVDEPLGFICRDCGSTIAYGEIFCHQCGAIISA